MADLLVTIGADLSQYRAGMQEAGATATTTSNNITSSFSSQQKSIEQLTIKMASYQQVVYKATNPAVISEYNGKIQELSDEINHLSSLGKQGFNNLANGAQSASMRLMQMRSGLSAVRDGVTGVFVGGQRADQMFMAMGHHFSSLINETGGVKSAFSALGSSLMGAGGIILGLTLAYELFKHFSKGAKETKDTLKNYEESLDAVTSATLKGEIAGRQETTRLQILYSATQNHTLSLKDRNLAYDELEKKYPAWFTNAEREKTLLGENKKKYDELVASVLAAAYAKAYEERIGQNAGRDIENQQKVLDINKKIVQAQKELTKAQKEAKDFVGSTGSSTGITSTDTANDAIIESRQQTINKLIGERNDLLTDSKLLNQQNVALQDKALEKEKEAGFKTQSEIDGKIKGLKKQKDGFAALEQAIELIKKKLEDAIIAHQPTVAHQLAIDLEKAEEKLQVLKKAYANSLLAGNGAPELTAKGTDVAITGGDTGLLNQGQDIEADVKHHKELQDAIYASQAAGKAWKAELKEENSLLRELSHVIGSGLMHAFESAMNGTQSFVQAMGQFLTQLIERLIAAAAAAAILAVALSIFSGGSLTIASAFSGGGEFSQLFGSMSGLGNVQQHATGGIFTSPRIGMFAEAGPEAIVTPKHLQEFAGVSQGGNGGVLSMRLQGSDMLLFLDRAQKSKSRTS